jgi:GWxTD domain-containing protein
VGILRAARTVTTPLKRTSLLLLLFLITGVARTAAAPAVPARASEQAEALYQRSLGWLARNTVDTRRQAVRALEQATLLAPGNATYELTLGRAYYASGFLKSARERFERVAQLAPGDAAGYQGLGLVWRRDWLKYLDRRSLGRAVDLLATATRLDPGNTDAWLTLAPLLVEQGDASGALRAAFRAARTDPGRLEARLAVAHALYRSGMLHEADSVFRATIPRLGRQVRECYEDISPVATEQDTMILHHLPHADQPAFIERFWRENDPDLSTPENEARLEYWARVTQAYFLFFDARRRGWDERGEVFVRYGPPAEMQYSPLGSRASWAFATGPEFPANTMVWSYPELGMRVVLQDRLLSEYYLLPVSLTSDPDPVPDPDSLARCADAIGTRGGRGVFHLLPPGATPLSFESVVARFEGAAGPRVLAQFEVAGGPGDSVWADGVVVDSARVVRARASLLLGPSACAAATRRAGDFAADLEPGSYVVSVTLRDGAGRRGILREPLELAVPRPVLTLSDVVIACGTPGTGAGPVRIEPNPGARVAGTGPLSAYFEIYHLQPGSDGLARFEYVYTVRPTAPDTRHWLAKFFSPSPPPPVSVSREERNLGASRRQFISVPVGSLPAGRYRLEVTVRDLIADRVAVRQQGFVKTM